MDPVDAWNSEAHVFDEAADHGLSDPAVRGAWQELLASVLPHPPCRIADLGCGTGTLTLLLAEQGHTVDGVDFAPRMVERARNKASNHQAVSIYEGDAFAPPLPAATYDAVVCRHVLWMSPDPVDSLSRWVRLLNPRGRLVIIEGLWSTGTGLTEIRPSRGSKPSDVALRPEPSPTRSSGDDRSPTSDISSCHRPATTTLELRMTDLHQLTGRALVAVNDERARWRYSSTRMPRS